VHKGFINVLVSGHRQEKGAERVVVRWAGTMFSPSRAPYYGAPVRPVEQGQGPRVVQEPSDYQTSPQ